MLRFQAGVRVGYYSGRLGAVLQAASVWSLAAGVDVDVNSLGDAAPDRLVTSLHPYDLAVDLDTAGDRSSDLEALARYLRRWLEPSYDVVLEADHVHIEFDTHRPPLKRTP